ncbi:hypothetical protein [Myxococcus sp. RHSTA-1-4]|uniref:hypothetical protein n=1 Tax=Myxococcus sp. RHSTA-1-4 TaxID=2874601 RepID=UPI001CBCEEEC|nr:hypothetical protein [Myxococcus sp. RHSTA-1-4]MBZ4423134.1 hypothetical protein [Myxococcus sp. RHSTA-1-4]
MIRRVGSSHVLPTASSSREEPRTQPPATSTSQSVARMMTADVFDPPRMRPSPRLPGPVTLPAAQTERAQKLAERIFQAATAYKNGDYERAYTLLTAPKNGLVKISSSLMMIKPGMSVEDVLDLARKKSFSSIEQHSITLLDFMLPPDGSAPLGQPFYENQKLAKRLLPIMLEEWMHQFQNENQGFISPRTQRFADDAARAGLDLDASTLREVDILATFHDWGFPVKKLGTVSQYLERGLFEAWHQAGDGNWKIRQ